MAKIIPIMYKYVKMKKASVWLALFYYKKSGYIITYLTSLVGGDRIFSHAKAPLIISNFLSKGWKIIEQEDIAGNDIGRKINDIQEMQRVRNNKMSAKVVERKKAEMSELQTDK